MVYGVWCMVARGRNVTRCCWLSLRPVKNEDAKRLRAQFGLVLNSNHLLVPNLIKYIQGDDSTVKRIASFEFTVAHDGGDDTV